MKFIKNTVYIIGDTSGSIILKNIIHSDAPSIRAASLYSSEIPRNAPWKIRKYISRNVKLIISIPGIVSTKFSLFKKITIAGTFPTSGSAIAITTNAYKNSQNAYLYFATT